MEDSKPGTSHTLDYMSDSDRSSQSDSSDDDGMLLSTSKKPKRSRRPASAASKLDIHCRALLGEANLRYARGDIDTARSICFEIMKLFPNSHEPYIILSQIYENTDRTAYKGFLVLASSLYGHDPSVWCRLAELEIEAGELRKAMSLYSKAIKADPKDMTLHVKRLELAENLNDHKYCLAFKKHMTKYMPRSRFQNIIEISKEVTKKYHEEKAYIKALEALQIPFKRIPKKVTQDLVNMMLELLLLTDRFTDCLDIFVQYCGFTVEVTVNGPNDIVVHSFEMPENVQIDIKVKFIVCLVKLKLFHLVPPLIDAMILEENVEEIGDLYLDVAEDLMSFNLQYEALKLLIPLVKSSTYNLAAVWLKYAECLNKCNMLEQAVEAYFTVMNMAPQHVEVLYPLAMTLLKLNKKTEALAVLSQDLSSNKIDVAVLIERMKLLKQCGDLDDYWKCAELLLSRHCIVLKYPEEIKTVITTQTYREKLKKIKRLRNFRKDTGLIETDFESIREPTLEVEYEIYKDILQFALDKQQYVQLQKLAFMGLISKRFTQQFKEMLMWALFACIHNNDTYHGYTISRDLVFNNPKNNLAWNLFDVLLQNADDVRHNRFISRLQVKLPNIDCLQVFEANYNLSAGNLNLAMKFYMKQFRQYKTPYLAFILGVILLQIYSKRKNSVGAEQKKALASTITALFLFYSQHRSKDADHEVFYNLGRMYHQLGIMYLAEKCYLKVLKLECDDELFGLKHEAAFNLQLIYKRSGNYAAARDIIIEHIVI